MSLPVVRWKAVGKHPPIDGFYCGISAAAPAENESTEQVCPGYNG